jgi:hypothetical protein
MTQPLKYPSLKFSNLKYFAIVLFFSLCGNFSAQTKGGSEDDSPKKKEEFKITEVVASPDSVPATELMSRAINWVKVESTKYKKSSGTTTGSKAECSAVFLVKPKDLNPEADYTGKVTMKILIECKDSKYKYTISEIKHTSKSGKVNGGNIDRAVPECGSMVMGDIVWKKLKGEAIKGANLVVSDLKAGMLKLSSDTGKEEW